MRNIKVITEVDLSPNIQRYLPHLDESCLHYKDYGLKHPSALYNLSVSKVETAIKDFIKIYKQFEPMSFEEDDKRDTSDLLKAYKNVLYSLREHLDDCFHVIKSFIPPPTRQIDDRNQYSWLQKNASGIVGELFKEIKSYKKNLDKVVNELKHNNGILCGTAFYDSRKHHLPCMGYFVANVVNDAFEPLEEIHKKMGNSSTAFSFRRDLTYHLVNMYDISDLIMKLVTDKLGLSFPELKTPIGQAPETKMEMFKDIIEMTTAQFPDEYSKPFPKIALLPDVTIKLEYPSSSQPIPNLMDSVLVTHSTDGHTRQFKVPYM